MKTVVHSLATLLVEGQIMSEVESFLLYLSPHQSMKFKMVIPMHIL